MQTETSFDLVIFDCDGVLVDSEALVNRVYVDMLHESGYHIDREQSLHEFTGASMKTRLETLKARLAWEPPPDFRQQFNARLSAAVLVELAAVPGVREVLEALTIAKCVASNGRRDEVRLRLETTGLLHYFGEAYFSAPEVGRSKPAPDVYLHAARQFATPPQRCAVIEDSLPGVQAGTGAGMTVFGYAPGALNARALEAAGARTFGHMQELLPLLQ